METALAWTHIESLLTEVIEKQTDGKRENPCVIFSGDITTSETYEKTKCLMTIAITYS